jgi:hypothetical protein
MIEQQGTRAKKRKKNAVKTLKPNSLDLTPPALHLVTLNAYLRSDGHVALQEEHAAAHEEFDGCHPNAAPHCVECGAANGAAA